MILRSVMRHVRDQNWFAVGLDFLIVVVGVFIGIQVANWNEERQQAALGEAYLARMVDDLSSMESYLENMIAETSARYALTIDLLRSASNEEDTDEALIDATQDFFTEGWRTPRLTVVDAVFEDLSSTGNLNLIDQTIRQQITAYYADLDVRKESIELNRDWSLTNDSRMIFQHDIYRWDRTFAEVIGEVDQASIGETVLEGRDDLARLAAMFYYIEKSSLAHYEAALDNTRALIVTINQAGEASK